MIGDPFAVADEGWPVRPASPASAAFTDLMVAALESVMVAQYLRRFQAQLQSVC